jgi:hypothetical protein
MRSITVKVQDQTYRDIRAWCAQHDTCVSHVVQKYLSDLPSQPDAGSPALPEPFQPNRRRARIDHSDLAEFLGLHE